MKAWRLVTARRLATAMSGEGAAKFPGRWNGPGHPVVYLAESRALAALEVLVHTEDLSVLAAIPWFTLAVEFAEALVTVPPRLPRDWRSVPAPAATRELGDAWLESARSVVLQVPSVTIHGECNYLVNPRHPDFARLQVGPPEPFQFDARLGRPRA